MPRARMFHSAEHSVQLQLDVRKQGMLQAVKGCLETLRKGGPPFLVLRKGLQQELQCRAATAGPNSCPASCIGQRQNRFLC